MHHLHVSLDEELIVRMCRTHLRKNVAVEGFTLESFDAAMEDDRLPPNEREDILQRIFDDI